MLKFLYLLCRAMAAISLIAGAILFIGWILFGTYLPGEYLLCILVATFFYAFSMTVAPFNPSEESEGSS